MSRRVILITTADEAEVRSGSLRALAASLEGQPCETVVVLRDAPPELRAEVSTWPSVVAVLDSPRASLSAVRNRALKWLNGQNVPPDCVVGFPDDDCRYPSGVVKRVTDAFHANPEADFLVGRYAPAPDQVDQQYFPDRQMPVDETGNWALVTSVGLFMRLGDVLELNGFNEDLGVGAALAAGEETDLALRAVRAGLTGVYVPSILVLHDYPTRHDARRVAAYLSLISAYGSLNIRYAPAATRAWCGYLVRTVAGRYSLRDARIILRQSLRVGPIRRIRRTAKATPDLRESRWDAVGQDSVA